MHPIVKYRLRRLLSFAGIPTGPTGKRCADLRGFSAFLRKRGFCPGTVVDVGVADGTFELYEAFPAAFHLLVEPMSEFEPVMKFICRRYNADYVVAAASNRSEEARIYFSDNMHGASMLSDESTASWSMRKIPSVRLDQVVKDYDCRPPFMIKVDVQGFEHVVLEGASGFLEDTDVIVLETALFRFREDRPLFDETIAFMKQLGFVPFDLFGGYTRPLDGALAQIDVAFVKENGHFRQNHDYWSADQRRAESKSLRVRARRLLRA